MSANNDRRGNGGPPVVSDKEVLSVIEKLKSGKSSVMAEARRLGCYHATLRKALRAQLGSKRFDALMDGIKTRVAVASAEKRKRDARRRKELIGKVSRAKKVGKEGKGVFTEQVTPPKPETDPVVHKRQGSLYLQPLGSDMVVGKTVELTLGETRVLLLQRLGDSLRITSARRTPRTFSDALVLGGTIIVPHDRVSDVCAALLKEAAG